MQRPSNLLNQFLVGARKNYKREIPWTVEAVKAFNKRKPDLAKATLLSHPSIDAPIRIVSDASDTQMKFRTVYERHW